MLTLQRRSTTPLEDEYEEFVRKDLPECRKLGYNPQRWLELLEELGAVEATKRCVQGNRVPDGFNTLYLKGQLDLTLEAGLWGTLQDGVWVDSKFRKLFDPQTLADSDARPRKVGYHLKGVASKGFCIATLL